MTLLEKELAALQNRTGLLTIRHKQGPITVPIKVNSARRLVGTRIDLLVSPIGGSGEVWASRRNVKLNRIIS